MSLELGEDVGASAIAPRLIHHLGRALSGELTVANHTFATAPDPTKGLKKQAR